MRAIRVHEHGGPDVLVVDDVQEPEPGPGQALVGVRVAGVNMIDLQQRAGAYPVSLPFTPGTEGAGDVIAVGADAGEIQVGDRVAFAGVAGAYAESIVAPADRLVPIPDALSYEAAAAVLLQGMTAHYLLEAIAELQTGDTVVIHAAAGGVGHLLTQMAVARGLQVVGSTSTREKAGFVRASGATEVVVRGAEDLLAVVERVSGGKGARVVFDSVGQATFEDSLSALARRGTLALFGQSSGPVPAFDVRRLQQAGSVFLTRPGLADYVATREDLLRRASAVFSKVEGDELRVRVHARFPLEETGSAHDELGSGTSVGKLVIETRAPAG